MPAVSAGGRVLPSVQVFLLYLALFVIADATSLTFEVRRHAVRMSLVEIPLVLALFYLPPLAVVLVQVAAKMLVHLWRRTPYVKLAFNAANVAAATAVAVMIVTAARPFSNDPGEAWKFMLVLLVAVLVDVLITVAAVLGVITLVQGVISRATFERTVLLSFVACAANATVGLMVLLTVQRTPWGVLVIAALAAVLVLAYQAYAQFMRQHRSAAQMYDLTRAIADNRTDGTLLDVLLVRVRELMQSEYATVWLPAQPRYPETLLSSRTDDRGLIDISVTPVPLRQRAVATASTVAAGPWLGGPATATADDATDIIATDVIVVPMRSGGAVIGTLEVVGRLGEKRHFRPEDVRMLETVAALASSAVENSRLVDRLRFDTHHDTLTGLPNRRRLVAALDEALNVRTADEVVAVVQFDVARLREVNDSLGYHAGDQVLAEIGRRLRALAPPAALVSRPGGDEYVVTLRLPDLAAAEAFAGELRAALRDPMPVGALTLDVNAAAGVAVYPDHGSDPETLLQRADLATYAAKSAPTGVQVFTPVLESRSARRLGLAEDLRRALEAGELEVYFQPKVSLPERELVGAECLARWEHPVHGTVEANDFVAVADYTGQLRALSEFVLREGLRRSVEFPGGLPISVNVAPRTLLDPQLPEWLGVLLDEYGVPADRLTLEIAESALVGDVDRPVPHLHRLRELGVRLSVDDFGTGHFSLSQLRRLPVQEVKIDQRFIQGVATDAGDRAIVVAVVELAGPLGVTVVAEGVESELTVSVLEELGCGVGQGFLFSRPVPYHRLEAWVAAQRGPAEPEPAPGGTEEVRRLRAVP